MPERTVLHVGTHKTGSTSIQEFLGDHESFLAAAGVTYPPGFLIPRLHSDLPLLTIRPERVWPARLRFPETLDPGWQSAAAEHVRQQRADASRPLVVWSHEDLSYVRFDDELERLHDLLGPSPVQVVVYRRDPTDFLRSYRAQLVGTGFSLSDEPSSFAYVEPDSWVADHEALIATYRRGFGAGSVTVVDYDEVVRQDRSVIPSFADILGVPRGTLPSLDAYFYNQPGGRLRVSDAHLAAIRKRAIEQSGR